jgi:hypothetical protein
MALCQGWLTHPKVRETENRTVGESSEPCSFQGKIERIKVERCQVEIV